MRTGNNTELDVMLVDDNDDDIVVMQEMFSRVGGASVAGIAFDGIEALEHLERTIDRAEKLPDVVLLDLNMPRMNGIEFLKEIRNDPNLSKSVVFVLTTSSDEEDKLKAYESHVAGYIVKSDAGQSFMKAVDMLDRYWRVVELPNQ